jgi:hypothetical protein
MLNRRFYVLVAHAIQTLCFPQPNDLAPPVQRTILTHHPTAFECQLQEQFLLSEESQSSFLQAGHDTWETVIGVRTMQRGAENTIVAMRVR